MLAGNPVDAGLNRFHACYFTPRLRKQVSNVRMVVRTGWRWKILPPKHQWSPFFSGARVTTSTSCAGNRLRQVGPCHRLSKIARCPSGSVKHLALCLNNVDLMPVQPHYYRVRQVEPCHQLWRSSQARILSILALGAMPKQQQKQQLGCGKQVPLPFIDE